MGYPPSYIGVDFSLQGKYTLIKKGGGLIPFFISVWVLNSPHPNLF